MHNPKRIFMMFSKIWGYRKNWSEN